MGLAVSLDRLSQRMTFQDMRMAIVIDQMTENGESFIALAYRILGTSKVNRNLAYPMVNQNMN